MEAFKEERYQDALPDLRKAADLGDAEAQYRCALMYLQGMGVERNGKEGIDWLIKAAKQGHEQARAASGKMFAMRTLHKERSAYVNRQDGISWYVAPE